jgi:hypothetical protein
MDSQLLIFVYTDIDQALLKKKDIQQMFLKKKNETDHVGQVYVMTISAKVTVLAMI